MQYVIHLYMLNCWVYGYLITASISIFTIDFAADVNNNNSQCLHWTSDLTLTFVGYINNTINENCYLDRRESVWKSKKRVIIYMKSSHNWMLQRQSREISLLYDGKICEKTVILKYWLEFKLIHKMLIFVWFMIELWKRSKL